MSVGAAAGIYRDGVRDGMEITLRLLLGDASPGGKPYEGDRPEELVVWAQNALDRIEEER